MKLKHVNPHNVQQLVPSWLMNPIAFARYLDDGLDRVFTEDPHVKPVQWDKGMSFWLEMCLDDEYVALKFYDDDRRSGELSAFGCLYITVGLITVVLPLNAMLKGAPSLNDEHCVYVHTIVTEEPLSYIGITKQRWFARLAQHRNAASKGSKLVFHSALRSHENKPIIHRILLAGVSYETAMNLEEEFVDNMTLYPQGLNMIPGGFAGIRYLSSLGFAAKNAKERDAAIESLADMPAVSGKPNPLCAARWASDQDYVNRVVCGHSGRLTVGQVQNIRRLLSFGKDADDVAARTETSVDKVKAVAAGKTYRRVA